MDNKKKGDFGESLAKAYLEKKDYAILEMQYSTPRGEIDIIAKDKDTLVFIEVKYRKTTNKGNPLEAITRVKQNKIIKTAYYYIIKNNIKSNIRFDAIGILNEEITHIENAFGIWGEKWSIIKLMMLCFTVLKSLMN